MRIVGTAIMFALIFDAFADPLIGELSDRTQSANGVAGCRGYTLPLFRSVFHGCRLRHPPR